MRLTFLLIVSGLLEVSASVYSQQTKLSMSLNNVTLEDAFRKIEDSSNFVFFYNADQVQLDQRVSLNAENKSIDEILTDLLKDKAISYKVTDRRIVLYPEDAANPLVSQQSLTVKGKVTDSSGAPLPGVTVIVKGTTQGMITDTNGNYSLANVPIDATLVFSFVGMKSQEMPVAGKNNINITMAEETIGLDEVVAIGYGTMKKSDLTGSVSSVKSDAISAFPTPTVSQALQGRASGVQVIQNTGQPGAAPQIRIRGTNSIKGSNGPIWIIDGFPGDQNIINVNDIESIEVLKDASATAIYGSRGANGVIIVTTKRGKAGITKVDYSGTYSMQTLRKKLDLMDSKEYMTFVNIQQLNDEGKIYFSESEINNTGKGTDWQDLMFRTAPVHDHSLTVSGGNEKTQFSVGTGYFDQEGIMLKSGSYQRISLRANVNHDISKKFSIAYNAILSQLDNSVINGSGGMKGDGLFTSIISTPPTLTPYLDDGSYRDFRTAYPFISSGLWNPVMYVNETTRNITSDKVIATLSFTYKPIDDLAIKISGNAQNSNYRTDNYQSTKYIGSAGVASISTGKDLDLNTEGIVTYQKKFNEKHDLTFTGVLTYEQAVSKALGASGSGFLSNIYETYNIAAASIIDIPSSSYSKWSLLSYLGRINYSFKSKYLATVSFRADGSSRYSEGNKWGFFPSGALAWRISDESFMDNIAYVSNLKLRVGYGETGSTAINPYSTLSMLSTEKTVFDKDLYTYFAPSSTYPGDLKWETTAQTDIGLDIGLFENRLNLTADYYIKNTRDLLNSVQMPRSTGYNSTIKNIGKIQNKGLDLQLDASILEGIFKWNLSANLSFNRNKVIKLHEGQDVTGSNFDINVLSDYINLVREGEPLGVFYGYKEDGYDENGHPVYLDLDGVEGITSADKTIIGDPNPNFIYSLNSGMSYKNFELNWFIQGVQGNDIYSLSIASQNYVHYLGLNMTRDVLYDHWTADTPNAKYPKISDESASLKSSNRFVYDGSYIRLKDVQLAYNIPAKKLGIRAFKSGKVYVSGQNLITITNYKWWDPEVNSNGGDTSLNQGIDYFTYPTLKGVTFGIKLEF
ncbi:MAG: SusC/RagA family TonB-linked outer membrane protein [Bacteroidetes bacterium GWF2_42_66]|nr:MAG: SusC/RagA family TonB-linked outer membrane protein [Bacteroidetes bacterium GWE2_42_39]OFY40338.1 MAG: SusC/RagA family TonB-linked outer membrane protein [Bacteroidetes bacterium GWF2_42_66]